jgi:hypothetical protein
MKLNLKRKNKELIIYPEFKLNWIVELVINYLNKNCINQYIELIENLKESDYFILSKSDKGDDQLPDYDLIIYKYYFFPLISLGEIIDEKLINYDDPTNEMYYTRFENTVIDSKNPYYTNDLLKVLKEIKSENLDQLNSKADSRTKQKIDFKIL